MAEQDRSHPITIVFTEYGMCLTSTRYGNWREIQDAFAGYKASLGPWNVAQVVGYLSLDYGSRLPFTEESVQWLSKSTDGIIWAQELDDGERQEVPINVRSVAAAAGEILERLDELYDQRTEAIGRLLATIDAQLPAIDDSLVGSLAVASKSRLLDLDSSRLSEVSMNRQALAATDELRQLCASVWGRDYAHASVEHRRLAELERLLDAGWDVDDPTADGMSLLHHAIEVEVDESFHTGVPLDGSLTTLLVDRGADLQHRWRGQTPLEAATERNHDVAADAIRSVLGGGHGD